MIYLVGGLMDIFIWFVVIFVHCGGNSSQPSMGMAARNNPIALSGTPPMRGPGKPLCYMKVLFGS